VIRIDDGTVANTYSLNIDYELKFLEGGSLETSLGGLIIRDEAKGKLAIPLNKESVTSPRGIYPSSDLYIHGYFSGKSVPDKAKVCSGHTNCIVNEDGVLSIVSSNRPMKIETSKDMRGSFGIDVRDGALYETGDVEYSVMDRSNREPISSAFIRIKPQFFETAGDMERLLGTKVMLSTNKGTIQFDSGLGQVIKKDGVEYRSYPFSADLEEIYSRKPDLDSLLGGKKLKDMVYLVVAAPFEGEKHDAFLNNNAKEIIRTLKEKGVPESSIKSILFEDNPTKDRIKEAYLRAGDAAVSTGTPLGVIHISHGGSAEAGALRTGLVSQLENAKERDTITRDEINVWLAGVKGFVCAETCFAGGMSAPTGIRWDEIGSYSKKAPAKTAPVQSSQGSVSGEPYYKSTNLAWIYPTGPFGLSFNSIYTNGIFAGLDPQKDMAFTLIQNHLKMANKLNSGRLGTRQTPIMEIPKKPIYLEYDDLGLGTIIR
jgi:hypothetical protein